MSEVMEILGYPMLAATMDEAVQLCRTAIVEQRPVQVGVLNAAKVVNARHDEGLHAAMLSCDVILADGQSVVWASRMLGRPLPERVAGIDLFLRLLELADVEHRSVYLLGATPEVVARVADVMRTQYPGARLVGYRDGYFDDEASVAQDIAAARPDMLFLGMTSPKKEKFLERYQPLMKVPVTHGVGGSFDILAGVTKRAPERWQRAGMEWAYRLVQEPRRMWKRYLRTNVLFSLMVARELLSRIPRPVPAPASHEAA